MIFRKALKFIHLPNSVKLTIAEAMWSLVLAKALIGSRPLKSLHRRFGKLNGAYLEKLSPGEAVSSRQVQVALLKTIAVVPWRSVCLDQAIACMFMLSRRKIPFVIFFGVCKDPDKKDKMKAHAWIQCGDRVLIGETDDNQFRVVAHFSNPK